MNKYIKRIWKGFAIFLAIIVVLYFALFIYVSINKQSIIKQVSAKISSRLSGEVTIKNAQLSFFTHFPQIAVVLEGINIRDSAFIKHGHTFFEAGKLSGSLGLMALIGKKDALNGIRIENATLYLFTDSTGYTNDYLLKGKKDSSKVSGSSKSNLKFITLKNTRLIVDNLQRAKKIDVNFLNAQADIENSDSVLHVLLAADALSHQLGFNLDKGSYLVEKTVKGDFDISYNKVHNVFAFQTSDVSIDKHSFKLNGSFYFNDDRHFDLNISTKNIEMPFGQALLTKKIATAISIISLNKPVNVEAAITGPLGGGEPYVKVNWSGKKANVQTPIVNFTNCTFTGSYNNEVEKGKPRNDENSRIELHGLTANWEGFDISSKNVYINNLVTPVIDCDVQSKFNLTTLNNVLQSNSIQLKEGNGELNILYKGPLMGTGNLTPYITGSVLLNNGLVVYKRRGIELENCNGAIVFGGHDIFVKNLKSTIRGNVITMNGKAAGVMTLINSEPDKIHLDWDVYSPQIKLEAFTSLLKSANSGSVTVKKGGLGKLAGQVDRMMDKASAHISLKADKLIFRKFSASAVNASMALFANDWTLNNVSLRHAGGSMVLNGSIKERNSSFYDVGLKTKLFNVDVKELMQSFNNFGQTGIEGDNLKGLLTADADVHMDLNREAIKSSNVQGTVNFSLKDGALINYEPMQKMQGFFKNRDFSHIYFAELKDRLDISSQEIKINRMEIQSTALTLFVEGVYGLKGNTDISIQAPLNNLKKRDETYVPENIGTDQKAGASIYLRGRPGSDGKIKFSADIFKKLRGKKN